MILTNLFWIISIWVATFIIGVVSWPSTALFFGKLSDRGYSLSKILGLIVITYFLFLSATVKILPLSLTSLILLILIWASFNFFLEYRYKIILKDRRLPNWKRFVLIEIAFLVLILLAAFVRAHQPGILGIERFPDFAFINSLFNARWLPLYDVWYLGGTVNYYYFGHVLAYSLLTISRVPPIAGFFVVVAWMFGLLGINIYRLGRDVLSPLIAGQKMHRKTKEKAFIFAGILSFFSVSLAGTWHTTLWFLSYIRSILLKTPPPNFWYPDATRAIPGTITDIPLYGFFESDLHPHMWGLFSGVIILTTLYMLWLAPKRSLHITNKYLWFLSFILGISYMTNSWDAFTLGVLSLFILIIKFWSSSKIKLLPFLFFVPIAAYVVALPWSLFFKAPIDGIGLVQQMSPFLPWISFWGPFLLLILIFLARIYWTLRRDRCLQPSFLSPYLFHLAMLFGAIFFIAFLEIIYFKDLFNGGEFFRVNTVFKVVHQVWLWIGMLAGSMMVWIFFSARQQKTLIFFSLIIFLIVAGQAIYPIKTIWQAGLQNKELTGLGTGLDWWQKMYPYDYQAYLFLEDLRKSLPEEERVKNIVEAEGESFTQDCRFSVFLGWPTIIGWPIHEWTWRGSYEVVGSRKEEVKEIYTGEDKIKTKNILKKYKINYIIVGEVEREKYKDQINLDKLLSLGKAIFRNEKTIIISL